MWINSPLGKWDQDALVEKALGDAERRRMLEASRGDWEGHRIGDILSAPVRRLGRHATPMHRAMDTVRSMLGALLVQEREPRQA